MVSLYTIGYGNRSVETVIQLLRKHEIQYLVDVRSVPHSKYNPGFNRESLDTKLREYGIRYVFLGEVLGGRPKDPSCYVDGKVDYARCCETDWYKQGISRLKTAWDKKLRVVLMCSEGKPEECHRSKLIGQTLAKMGVETLHIDEKSGLKTQAEVISKLIGEKQLGLFDITFTSRKRYREEDKSNA